MGQIKLLPNTMGDVGTSMHTADNTDTTNGYDKHDIITGPRMRGWRGTNTSGHRLGFTKDTAQTTIHYMVIARCDQLFTIPGTRIWGNYYTATSFGGYNAGTEVNTSGGSPISLIGPKSQDYVYPHYYNSGSGTTAYGFRAEISYQGSVNAAAKLSKVYFSTQFTFGDQNPQLNPAPQWEYIDNPEDRPFLPLKGHYFLSTERRITLQWKHLQRSVIDSFKALPQILAWPVFLYDEDADIFPEKLIHCVVETFAEEFISKDNWNLTIIFRQLAYSDF